MSGDPARAAVRDAIVALSREYERSLRDPSKPARVGCSYFKDHPSSDVTAEAIASALVSSSSSAYVKWQLLSGLPDVLDDDLRERLLVAYRDAPLPIPRPGISIQDQQRFDLLVQGVSQSDEPKLIEAIEVAVAENRVANAPILAYRNELYSRLPKNAETFATAMEDLMQRVNAAADGKDLVKQLASDIEEWAAADDQPRSELSALGKAARRLADTKSPQYYGSVSWRASDNQFAWRKTRAGIDSGKTLKDLAIFLEEQSRKPAVDKRTKVKKN